MRYASENRVRRVRWSQGETQVLELGGGSPLLLVHGGGTAPSSGCRSPYNSETQIRAIVDADVAVQQVRALLEQQGLVVPA